MPVKLRSRDLETATARLRLPEDKRPYWSDRPRSVPRLRPVRAPAPGLLAHQNGKGSFGLADDYQVGDGARISSFHKAVDKMHELMRPEGGGNTDQASHSQ